MWALVTYTGDVLSNLKLTQFELDSNNEKEKTSSYPIGEVGGHDEVVLNDEPGLLGVKNETFDHLEKNEQLAEKEFRQHGFENPFYNLADTFHWMDFSSKILS